LTLQNIAFPAPHMRTYGETFSHRVDAAFMKEACNTFMNTAGRKQPVIASFGTENVKAIRKVTAKYDPTQLLQKLQNNGYLLRYV
jgi:hypothetical protein